jgi:L-alanine-DL-glutamate epimerase-like enolase superfamily enzyme
VSGGASAGGRLVRGLAITPVSLALTEPFAIAGGAPERADNVVVRIELEDGTIGLGEAAPFEAVTGETQRSTLDALDRLRELVLGADAAAWRALAAGMTEIAPDAAAARCAVEQAVIDALARRSGLSVGQFFGGRDEPLETDVTIIAGGLDHAREMAAIFAARGFQALKVKVGKDDWREDADRIEAVSRAAPGVRILIDANGGYDVKAALALLGELKKRAIAVRLFEQPVHPKDLDGMARVAKEGGVTVCADESARSAADVIAIARRGAAGAVNLKITKTGVVEALGMWHVAQAAGLEVMIGGMVEAELAMTFSAHFASGLGGFAFVDLDTPLFLKESPFRGGFTLDRDRIVMPTGLGVGVTLP